MHPVAIVAIAIAVPLAVWGVYEGGEYLWRKWQEEQERRQYQEYVRQYNEKRSTSTCYFTSSDDEDDDDDRPLMRSSSSSSRARASGTGLRRRHAGQSDRFSWADDYELAEMEKSLYEKRAQLALEQSLLDEQMAELQRRRQSIQNRGNSIMGMSVTSMDDSNHTEVPPKPDFDGVPSFFTRPTQSRTENEPSSRRSSSSNNNSEASRRLSLQIPSAEFHQPPSPEDSDGGWSRLDNASVEHQRMQSDTSDLSFASMRTPQAPSSDNETSSYGVMSMSDDDDSVSPDSHHRH